MMIASPPPTMKIVSEEKAVYYLLMTTTAWAPQQFLALALALALSLAVPTATAPIVSYCCYYHYYYYSLERLSPAQTASVALASTSTLESWIAESSTRPVASAAPWALRRHRKSVVRFRRIFLRLFAFRPR